jgi:DNA-binding winged helix-turn-helix (wHTH) protein/TolB-like protein/Flp pilus assembly protein TadD
LRQWIGEWEVIPESNELRRGGAVQRIEPKAMELLVYLAARPGDVVTRAELLEAVWPGVVVGDEALTQAVTKLRKALADPARSPAYIETISKRGYRLVADVRTAPFPVASLVEASAAPAVGLEDDAVQPVAPRRPHRAHMGARKVLIAALLASVVALTAALWPREPGHGLREERPPSVPELRMPSAAARTIAVGPFENLAGDPRHDYLTRGIAADLATDLGALRGLTVIEEPGATPVAETGETPDYRVAGTLQVAGNRLRVNVRLVEVASGRHLWSERYERPLVDLAAVQREIVTRLLEALPVRLSEAEQKRAARRYTPNDRAYDLFLQGQAQLASRQPADAVRARELYLEAIALDPAFARAYAALALTHAYESRYHWTTDSAESLQRALELGETARQITEELPEVHWVLAFVHAQRREHDAAIARLKRALELNASHGDAYALLGAVLTFVGRPSEALPFLRTALRLTPERRAYIFELLGRAYFFLGDLEQAAINLREAVSRNPTVLDPHVFLTAALLAAGERDAARFQADEIRALDPAFTSAGWVHTWPGTVESQKIRLTALLRQLEL